MSGSRSAALARSVFVALSSFGASLASRAQATVTAQLGGDEESSAWTAVVSDEIRRAEYDYHALTAEPGVWSAPNRSHELRSRVSRAGLEVFSRATSADGDSAEWKLTLRTVSFGRLGDLRELGAASIATHGARVELDHGLLTEWFVNDERGIEQGWTITARPRGVEPLWIGLDFGGELSLRIEGGGRSGVLVDACGEAKLRYRDLAVFDATGRELEARIVPSPIGVGIRVDDTNAVYPVTVDPVLTGPAWTADGTQSFSNFGTSVSSAGDVNGDGYSDVIVGAPWHDNGQGAAFVYLGSATGLQASAAWSAADGQSATDLFGDPVATAGDVNGDGYSDVIIGAQGYSNGQPGEGRVFVYLGSAGGLSASAAWTAESNHSGAAFGIGAATAGDVNGDGYSDVLVGAPLHDNGQSNEGRAFVYLGSASGLAVSAAWTAESDQIGAQFGINAGTAGDVNGDGYSDVIVGASLFDSGQTDEGRAFLYLGSSSGLATSAVWTAESDQGGARFGGRVATASDVNGDGYSDVIVGAPGYENGQFAEGRAFVYLGGSTGLSTSAAWTAESNQASAEFGVSASSAGDVNGDGFGDVIVGADAYDNGQFAEGRAFVYLGSASGLAVGAAWTAESDQPGAAFGHAVSTAGDVNGDGYSDVIVGSDEYDTPGTDRGRAFVYHGSALGLASSTGWTAESDQLGAALGVSVSSAGDVNGDGYGDVIVGAPAYDGGQTDEGRALVYLGAPSGLATSAAWTRESDQASALFGYSVSTAGDVNGDGFGDVIVGAYAYDNGQTDEGRAFVYLGSASGLSTSAAWTAESNQADARFGLSATTAGDVNGDGYGDVIVGAYRYDNGQTDEGRAYVYLGRGTGLSTSASWTAESNQASAEFGVPVSSAGDVNRDGYSDVIVGAHLYDNGQTDEGRAYVYLGSAMGLGASASWTAESNQSAADFGANVSTAGDVNGDGYSDVIVGAATYDNGESNEGRAFVYLGSATGPSASAAWTAESNQASARFGSSVSSAGDVNNDGYSDVIVGAYLYDNGETDEGRAFVYLGSATGLNTSAGWTAESDQLDANFGVSVASAGDVNGDGYSDVIVGAHLYDNGQLSEGRSFVYLGNEGRGGWLRATQQRRSDNLAPISLLARANTHTGFRVRVRLDHSPAGFYWASGLAPLAHLEWEVAHLIDPLDGTAIDSGADQSLEGGSLNFNSLAYFPLPAVNPLQEQVIQGPFHWRARLRTNNPLFPVTPWVTLPGNCVSETKLRSRKMPGARDPH